MNPTSDSMVQQRPHSVNQRPSGGTLASEVFGFPIAENQFNALQILQPAKSQRQLQREEGLVDPRTTRHLRVAAKRAEAQGILADGEIPATVPVDRDAQGTSISGTCVNPVVSGISPSFFVQNSFSASSPEILDLHTGGPVHYLLESGAVVGDALYYSNLNEVACTNLKYNKRISTAGQEWSAGRLGNRPIGARTAARNSETCLGPYATGNAVQPQTGHNPCEEE